MYQNSYSTVKLSSFVGMFRPSLCYDWGCGVKKFTVHHLILCGNCETFYNEFYVYYFPGFRDRKSQIDWTNGNIKSVYYNKNGYLHSRVEVKCELDKNC